eukprot:GDKH01005069.1.p1 GENE.GDKH01005069.1~~GDKH01005069.1.p1  ORF type:complete len:229 (+),score=52.67 GDKH01005069.1:175-861(+)
MSTAHRPTWNAAMGGTQQSGNRVSGTKKMCARDLAGQTKLKFREPTAKVDAETFQTKLQQKEQRAAIEKRAREGTIVPTEAIENPEVKRLKLMEDLNNYENPFPEDADDDPTNGKQAASDSDSDSDDDDDEEEMLMKELAKIKAEREAEQRKKQEELDAEERERAKDRALQSNPLLAADDPSLTLQRRWDDDVVFRNQAKTAPKAKQRFINDVVRSDFHRRFLGKYVQ